MAVTAAKSVMAFRVLTMAVDLCRLTTRTMNVNAGHVRCTGNSGHYHLFFFQAAI
ncbi:glutamate decarboxylase isozyme [Shigella dysenteriae 1617]|nr:glutamate decarboxylase isozyme [Shigella dysenteriae 1617]